MRRPKQLGRLASRLMVQANRDDVAGLSAELAYRTFLELFPFFIFLSMLGGAAESVLHVSNPARLVLDLLSQSLPQGAADPIRQQLENVLNSEKGLIGLPIVGVLWLAAGSGASLLKAMNRIYEIEETRPFWERYLVGLWLTILAGGVLASAFLILSLGQILAQQTGGDSAPSWFQALAGFTRWPLLVLILLVEASVVFRVAPNRKPPWRLITPGALVFVIGWMFASTLFVLYVDKSGGYAGTYGVLGGVVVLLLWLQITAYALLLGAELNDLLEHPSSMPAHLITIRGDQRADRPLETWTLMTAIGATTLRSARRDRHSTRARCHSCRAWTRSCRRVSLEHRMKSPSGSPRWASGA